MIIPFEEFEIYKYNEIKQKLNDSKCSQMWANQREFLNGIVRKFKPKKIVEIGVASGGSSIIFNRSKSKKLYRFLCKQIFSSIHEKLESF